MTDLDALFDVLASDRRRWVIHRLGERDPRRLDDLADELTREESETAVQDRPPSRARKARYVSLYQVHLPALCEADVVAWGGASTDAVRRGPAFEAAHDMLRAAGAAGEGSGLLGRVRAVVGGDGA